MFLSTLLAAALALGSAGPPPVPALPFTDAGSSAAPVRFEPAARRVTNWRDEAIRALHPAPLAWLAWLAPQEPTFVARCVRLNNYWCIKHAAWAGEIGADGEGHTAFADARAGADAAVALLRRYYAGYGRRSAFAIVRRWAPAACAGPARAPMVSTGTDGLAVHGLGRTLRARFLARHTRSGLPRGTLARGALARGTLARGAPPHGSLPRVWQGNHRIQPYSPIARLAGAPRRPPRPATARPIGPTAPVVAAAPTLTRVMAGAEAPPTGLTLLDAGAGAGPLAALEAPPPLCTSDTIRIANYAAQIAGSVGLGPNDDLHLFDAAGRPLPALEPVMLAMSAVELGTFRAQAPLVAAAITRATPSP